MENWRHYADGQRLSFTRIRWSWLVVVCGGTNHSHMCARTVSLQQEVSGESVLTAHTISTRVPLVRGETTGKSSISPSPWSEARSINDVRGSVW